MATSTRGAFVGGGRLLERGTRDQARLAWRLLRDPRVSGLKYVLPALMLAYLASPVDALPDLLLGIGHTDDVGVAVLGFMMIIRIMPRLAPANVVSDHVRDMGLQGSGSEADRESSRQAMDARFTVRR